MATLKDIAKQAGVSIGTVSGVLNGARNFSEDTRKRVLAVAAELKYAPNLAAKSIRRNPGFAGRPRTNIIAYVTREENAAATDSFTSRRSLLLTHVAAARGYHVLPLLYDKATAFSCAPIHNGYVDGVLAGIPDIEIAQAVNHLAPLVLMDVPFAPHLLPSVPRLNFDIACGMGLIVKELMGLGHRRAATLTLKQDAPFHYHAVRCPILQRVCADLGLDLHPSLSRNRQLAPSVHEQVMQEYVDEALPLIKSGQITALIMADDVYAADIAERLLSAGIRIPDEVSICGFANSELRRQLTPMTLTTVNYPWRAMVSAALDMVIAEIKGCDHRQGEILIRPEFVRGATTAACPVSEAVSN